VAAPIEVIERCIENIGIGFLFAPRHHPAFKAVAEIRRELGVRTIFNLLGPLANPAGARHQVMGVYEERWVPIVGRVLSSLGAAHAFVVHGQGLDELAVTGTTSVCEVQGADVYDFEVSPEELGLERWNLHALLGGDAAKNAAMLRDVLSGQKGGPRDAVIANAAAALVAGEAAEDLLAGARAAAHAIDHGGALAKLQDLIRMTQAKAA
jgi:anthranilate phosphoribosyltransferase